MSAQRETGVTQTSRPSADARAEDENRRADVCVVIVNWNTCDALDACLSSVEDTAQEVDARLVVVDNGSTDGSIEMLGRVHPSVHLVTNDDNRGFAAAVNQGLDVAFAPPTSARTVLLLNSDTRLRPGTLDRCVKVMLERPRVGALGCRLMDENGEFQVSCHRFPTLPRLLLGQSRIIRPIATWLRLTPACTPEQHDAGDFEYIKGAFLLLRSKAVEDVGRLDERFFMYAEEADLCLRLRRAGWELIYLSDAEVVHVGGGSTGGNRGAPVASVNRLVSRLKFMQKHEGWLAFRMAVALHVLTSAVRWLKSFFLGREDARALAWRKMRAAIVREYEIPERD